jgi:anti-sigma B factor antagonist
MNVTDPSIEIYYPTAIISLEGTLDAASTSSIQTPIIQAANEGHHVLLDMSRVVFLSSAGLRMLLLLYRRVRENQRSMVLAGLSDEVRTIMEITGFLDLFTIAENREQGLKAIADLPS